jgi:transcriptional regulator with XRE-family HTH domain
MQTQEIDQSGDWVAAPNVMILTPGEMLRELRELHGLSQLQLSIKCGIEQTHISAIENGRSELGRDRAITLADALQVRPEVLLFSASKFRDEYKLFIAELLNRRETIGHGSQQITQAVVKSDQVLKAASKSGIRPDDIQKIVKYVFEPRYIAHSGSGGVVTIDEKFASKYL